MCFSGFCCYSVSHCSNKPTIKIIDWSFLCQWANVQNQQGIKYFFFPLYVLYAVSTSVLWTVAFSLLHYHSQVWGQWIFLFIYIFLKKLIVILGMDTLNWSKVTIKLLCYKIFLFQIIVVLLNFLFIKESLKVSHFHKNITLQNCLQHW